MLLFYSIIFLLGLAVGSFLNVVIFRLESGKKIVNDRSMCMSCGHILAWHDLLPVLSFILLRGKCRYCREKISWQYPIVELATGIVFVLITKYQLQIIDYEHLISQFPDLPISISYLLFIASSLIVMFVYDLKHYIISDKVIYPAIIVALAYSLFSEVIRNNFQFSIFNFQTISNFQFLAYNLRNSYFINHFFAAFLAGGFFFSIVWLTKGKGMGGGDVKLAFLMGLILGWPVILVSVFLSFIVGSIFGISLIFMGKKKMKSMIPFGPFLIFGTFVGLFWGEKIVKWYLGLID
jgi:leader peptidase (prepilin peptidase) / N-methyltransferase